MSVVIHEVAHGFVALRFGDRTALNMGRLTLNPIPHLDLFGSIILPALLVLSGSGFLIGWAKPVPYNPHNLSNRKWGEMWVASAGILANFALAILFGFLLRFVYPLYPSEGFYFIASTVVLINIALGLFNLVPIPPLDGSKILFTFLSSKSSGVMAFMNKYSLFLLLAFILFFADILIPILLFLFKLITGFSLL